MPEVNWVSVLKAQTPDHLVYTAAEGRNRPKLIECTEAVFTESGLDVVTESQWILVLGVVVNRKGLAERFKVLRRPLMNIDLEGPLTQALKGWRYHPVAENGEAVAVCDIVVIKKPLGYRSSSNCGAKR